MKKHMESIKPLARERDWSRNETNAILNLIFIQAWSCVKTHSTTVLTPEEQYN